MGTSSQKNHTAYSDDNEGFLRSFKSSLEGPTREHLMKMYTCLMMSHLAATAGACFHLFTEILSENFLPFLIGVAFMVTLSKTPYENGKNVKTRIGLLFGFSLFTGLGLKPLLGIVINIDPANIGIAFLSTTQICYGFLTACLACALLMCPRGLYLFLGGPLLSLLFLLTDALASYYFAGSMILFDFYLNMGFAVVCGLLLYDTHRIIEKHRLGDEDYVSHSTDLFSIVFVDIYRFLTSIPAKKEEDVKDRSTGTSARTRM